MSDSPERVVFHYCELALHEECPAMVPPVAGMAVKLCACACHREVRVTVPDEDVRIAAVALCLETDSAHALPACDYHMHQARKALEAVYLHWRQRELALRELVAEQQLDEARKLLAEMLKWMESADLLIHSDRGVGPYEEDDDIARWRDMAKALGMGE